MHRNPPQIQNFAGYAALSIDPTTMLSNEVNVICSGNQRAAYRAVISMEMMMGMFGLSLGTETDWLGMDTKFSSLTAKERLEAVTANIRPFIMDLTKKHVPVNNLGDTIRGELLGQIPNGSVSSNWSGTYVDNPALGYPRQYIYMNAESGLENKDCTLVVTPSNDWSRSIAELLFILDKTRMSTDLIPKPANVAGHDFRDQPFGILMSTIEQAVEIWSLFTLYASQGMIFSAHINKRWNMKCLELAMALEPRAREALERWAENYEYVLRQPLHPLLMNIATALQTGQVTTYANVYDLMYRWGMSAESLMTTEGTREMRDKMAGPIIRAALADVEMARTPMSWSGGVGGSVYINPTTGKPEFMEGIATIGHAARILRSIEKITEKWSTITTKLKWGSLTSKVDMIWQAAADYNLTDGLDYGEDPTACVLGLKPAISAGDFRIAGFFRRDQSDWDSREGERIEFSVMPVKGYQSATTGTSLYERNFIVEGMWMGEPDVDRQFATLVSAGDDPIGKAVLSHWSLKLKAYVAYGYQEATGTKDDTWMTTDWAGWTMADSPKAAEFGLLEAYRGQTRDIDRGVFLYRSYFSHRCVVRRARADVIDRFNEFGVWMESMEQDGHVRWNGDVNISMSDAPLQALVDIAVVSGVPGAQGMPSPSTEEAIATSAD